jgi:hypothetical protein
MKKPHSIGWSVDKDGRGYTVNTYLDNGDRDVYQSGNNPRDSQSWLPADHPDAESVETLERYAKQTAAETAAELELSESAIFKDDPE